MGLFENNLKLIDKFISICYSKKRTTFNGCYVYYEDVKQNCYIDVYKGLLKFDNEKCSIEGFIYLLIENSIHDQIKALNRDKRKVNYLINTSKEYETIEESTNMNTTIEINEIINTTLTDKEIKVITLLNKGYNTVEIAKIMNYTPPNIRKIRNKVRVKLQEVI